MRRAALIATLLVVVLAGCTAPIAQDPIGQEGDVAWDTTLNVTSADGLNASERRQVVDRAMARLEHLRDLEFDERVPVTVVDRAEYLANRSGGDGGDETFQRWNDQVWEGLFIVGEDRSFHEVQNSTLGSQVLGFYSPGRDEIVIVSDSPTPTLSRGTLVHELVHALQDQQLGFGEGADTQDLQLAHRSVTEGEANYLQSLYEQRCNTGWSCIDSSASNGGGGNADAGVLLVILQPYVTGPGFVESVRSTSGWTGVNALYERFPESTEQVLHPEKYPDESPEAVTVADRSNDEWERFDVDPVGDTLGEASIFAMVEHNGVREGTTGRYSFQDEASAGWGGDTLVPYQDGDRYGYVWKTVWDTREDAREFRATYGEVLAAHDAERRGEGVFVVPDADPFGDAFRVTRAGSTVTIVNAPTPADLADVHVPAG
ncbi:MAG: Hvo_1808 family surface protein [Haloarculaceae archaeon]